MGDVVRRTAGAKGTVTVQEPTRAQHQVARRVAEARATVPDFTLTAEVDMQACVALRARLAERGSDGEQAPTTTDLIVKACGLALREHPRMNAAYKDATFELYGRVNVAVVLAGEDDTPVAPTVFDADAKSLEEIARELDVLARRARSGAITAPEVSDLGRHGVTRFAAIIAPPHAAALAVGALGDRAVVRDSRLVARHVVDLTLTCDHRIVYGPDAARFLGRVREVLEAPAELVG